MLCSYDVCGDARKLKGVAGVVANGRPDRGARRLIRSTHLRSSIAGRAPRNEERA